jgi:hypothetical protein
LLSYEDRYGWIRDELAGYSDEESLPDYRILWVNFYYSTGFECEVPERLHWWKVSDPMEVLLNDAGNGRHYAIPQEKRGEIYSANYSHPYVATLPSSAIYRARAGALHRLLETVNALLTELEYSSISDSIFETVRLQVDKRLAVVAEGAAEKLMAIYEKIGSSKAEDWSQIALECRRMLKEVADSLYPASDEPFRAKSGKEYVVKDDDYVNRLLAFADSNAEGDERRIIIAETEHLGSLLAQVNEFAGKGVHGAISEIDAHRVVVYTYLLLGDLLVLKQD